MTRKEKFNILEELCQQKYQIIDQCYQTIAHAQWELAKLETQYLKAKANLEGKKQPKETIRRTNKISRLRRTMLELGLDSSDIDNLITIVSSLL